MPILVILVDKDGHNPDGILGTGITWQMLVILAQVDGHNPDRHSDGRNGCKVNLKVLVILSVMTVLTCHGSNDDSSDKKF